MKLSKIDKRLTRLADETLLGNGSFRHDRPKDPQAASIALGILRARDELLGRHDR